MSIIDKIFKKKKAKAIARPKNILVLSDFLTASTGVARQTLRMVQWLEATGRYKFVCLGAIASQDPVPQEPIQQGDNITLLPYNSYGDAEKLRNILDTYQIDAIWFMTDPRFYTWLPAAIDSIAEDYPQVKNIPLVYYHVWDNFPGPVGYKVLFDRVSHIACISKLTLDCMSQMGYGDKTSYLPHTVDLSKYGKISEENRLEARKSLFDEDDVFIFFWNGKNMMRKQPELMLRIFAEFKREVAEEVEGLRKPVLLMKTSHTDGQNNLYATMQMFGLDDSDVKILDKDMSDDAMVLLYNVADITCNTSFAEGFGLPVLESLACGTPVIAPLTGGIPEQILGENAPNGQAVEISGQCIVSGQNIPALYQDFFAVKTYTAAMWDLYNAKPEVLADVGALGRGHVEKNFPESYLAEWDKIFTKVIGV